MHKITLKPNPIRIVVNRRNKAELDEIVITGDKDMTWSFFKKKLMKKCEKDKEDGYIFYHTEEAKRASWQLRTLNCIMNNCQSK